MSDTAPQGLGVLAKLVVVTGALLILAGAIWHGFTLATMQRLWHDLAEEPSEPMKFRFILQPLMAAIVATLHGLRDARAGRSPYLWRMLRNPGDRTELLREGLNATARVMLLAIVMDLIYQALVLKRFYPGEAIIVALLLGLVPYVLFRGPTARIAARWWAHRVPHG